MVAFPEHLNTPVITTFLGKGQISDHQPLASGAQGRSGAPIAGWLTNESDTLLLFGASFNTRGSQRGTTQAQGGRHVISAAGAGGFGQYLSSLVDLYSAIGMFAVARLLGAIAFNWVAEVVDYLGALTIAGVGDVLFTAMRLAREDTLLVRFVKLHFEQLGTH